MPNTKPKYVPAWKPSCSLEAIKTRAEVYTLVRDFFSERNVLEVDTPVLSRSTATDPFLESIPAMVCVSQGLSSHQYYLHTSPEFPMKRLLAAGSGAIYQICKTFRNSETGHRHNPEFTMLEWYRPGFELSQLMAEVNDLLAVVLDCPAQISSKLSYREAFQQFLDIDPYLASDAQLICLAEEKAGYVVQNQNNTSVSRDDYLNVLLSICIEPNLGLDVNGEIMPVFLYAYPPSQAALAKLTVDEYGQEVAERFEVYIRGLEIANGYFELTDAKEQRYRFEKDNEQRSALSLPSIPMDENLLNALQKGLPECSGVALGMDRLLMVKLNASRIEDVISFPIMRA
jgi:lysyl-tRNA synthetase class 2